MTVNRRRDGKQAKRFHINGSRGFTLIELLVVVSLISLLSSIVLASLDNAREQARNTSMVAEMKSVRQALELYREDNGEYLLKVDPTDGDYEYNWMSDQYGSSNFQNTIQVLVDEGYLPEVPHSPNFPDNPDTYFVYWTADALDNYACDGVLFNNRRYALIIYQDPPTITSLPYLTSVSSGADYGKVYRCINPR